MIEPSLWTSVICCATSSHDRAKRAHAGSSVGPIVALLSQPREQSCEPEIPIRPRLRASVRVIRNEDAGIGPVVQRAGGNTRQSTGTFRGVVPSGMTERKENELLLVIGQRAGDHRHAAPLTTLP